MKERLYSLFALSVVAALFMSAACGGGSATSPSIPAAEPIAIEGLGGSKNVEVDASFTKSFDPEVDCSTVTDSTCYIALAIDGCDPTAAISAALTCSGESVEIDPVSNLEFATSYIACFTSDITQGGIPITSFDTIFTTVDADGNPTLASTSCTNSLNCETGEMCLFGICSSEFIEPSVDCEAVTSAANTLCVNAFGEGFACSPLIEPSTGECTYHRCVNLSGIVLSDQYPTDQYPVTDDGTCEAAINGAYSGDEYCYPEDLMGCVTAETGGGGYYSIAPFITNAHTLDLSDEFTNWVGIDDTSGDFPIIINDASDCGVEFLELVVAGIGDNSGTSIGIATSADGSYVNMQERGTTASSAGLSFYIWPLYILNSISDLTGAESGDIFYLDLLTGCDESGCDDTSGNPWDVRITYTDIDLCN